MLKIIFLPLILLSGCVSDRVTLPVRSATEQLLISEAADAAAIATHLQLPSGKTAYLDLMNFSGDDGKYAGSAVRQSLIQQGNRLVENRETADIIIEARVGALSIDSASHILGIPAIRMASLLIPTYSIERSKETGIAKYTLFAYDRRTGELIAVVANITGYSHRNFTKLNSGVISWVGTAAAPPK